MIGLTINGAAQRVPAGHLVDLLRHLGLDEGRRGLAVAVNGQVVPRAAWSQHPLAEGDRLEIVRAVSGG